MTEPNWTEGKEPGQKSESSWNDYWPYLGLKDNKIEAISQVIAEKQDKRKEDQCFPAKMLQL